MILLGTSLLAPIKVPLKYLLVHIHTATGLPWAWSIIALTAVVRLVLLYPTIRQQQSMRRMQAIQPQIKALQDKYRGNRQVLNQKMMEFYRENKVNPFASCLPILLQLPIFIGLYFVLRDNAFIQPGDDRSFLGGFVPDITSHLQNLPRASLVVLMVIYIGSQVGSTLLMPSTADPKQKYIFAALPVLFAGFILSRPFPAGLLIYWITSNLWTVGQAAAIRHWYPPPEFPALAAPASKKKPPALAAPAPKKKPPPRRPSKGSNR